MAWRMYALYRVPSSCYCYYTKEGSTRGTMNVDVFGTTCVLFIWSILISQYLFNGRTNNKNDR